MKDYQNFEIEDFLLDENFVQWVKSPNAENKIFWEQWIVSNPAKASTAMEAKDIIKAIKVKPFKEISSSKVESHVQDIMEEIHQIKVQENEVTNNTVYSFSRWIKIAAVLAVAIGISWVFYHQNDLGKTPIYEELTASSNMPLIEQVNNNEKPIYVNLSDGSKITLYKNSRLSYPSVFKGNNREVYLMGDAFFNIAKNPNKPFLVHAGTIVTKVLGTSFYVKAPTVGNNIDVEVITGKVSVFEKDTKPNSGVVLSPNHKVTFYDGQHHFVTGLIDNPQPQGEKDNVFEFKDTPLSEVLAKLSNVYGIRIDVDNEKLYDCPLTADFTTQSLHAKLEIICATINGSYETKGTVILISGRGCGD
ncbi:FecR family protein [Arcicella aquatica]|uniref:FecR family protein n=1 Tax=Arcicella aquatica TaxID=217141 RepID=A0ABU5QLQ1_9BACT|nr:FecR family protein [Arcicella aquatica]MEA5257998.1 FecR family protein [Arcicella aquatica]